jgi:hypothetical protein
MSAVSTKLKLSNKGHQMKHFDTITITNVTFPIEFFGNFYFADCPCGVELIGYTKEELKSEMIGHTC